MIVNRFYILLLQIQMQVQELAFILSGIIIMIILYIFFGKLIEHKHWHFLHQTGIGIIIGLIFGILSTLTETAHEIDFNEELFFFGLLPPMIFAGGYNLKKQNFGKNFKYILLFGLLGTIVSFGVIFGLTYLINELKWIIPLKQDKDDVVLSTSLMVKFSATISATDSVAALTLIDSIKFPKMFSIIFGEGMVNDAVAIILFKVVGGIFDKMEQHPMESGQIAGKIILSFFVTVLASIGIGLVSSLVCSLIFKKMRFLIKSEVSQVVLTYMFGILSYVIAQQFDMSGVITVLICGVTLAHYNFYNLSPGGMHATSVCLQFIAFIAESIVFIYLGISIVYYFESYVFSLSFLGLQLLICIIARAMSIFGLSLLFRIFDKNWTVNNSQLSVVTIAGTIRGSVAFALILTIQGNQQNDDEVKIVKSTTLVMVCITTIILGALMPLFIKLFLGKKKVQNKDLVQHEKQEIKIQEIAKEKKESYFKKINEQYIRPFFIYEYKEKKSYYSQLKRAMKLNSKGESKQKSFDQLIRASVNFQMAESRITHTLLTQN